MEQIYDLPLSEYPESVVDDGLCEDCLSPLPDPVTELRADGQWEAITYCRCGATYV